MWATERYFNVLGTRFQVRATTQHVGERVDELLRPFSRPRCGVPGRRRYSLVLDSNNESASRILYQDCRPVHRSGSWAAAVGALLGELNRGAIEQFDGFAVHAGVVSSAGRALAFPASSGDGKSTLTAACVAAGFDYVSDEALCLDFVTGRVMPYPKPLMLSPWSREAVGLGGLPARFDDEHDELELPVLADQLGARLSQEAELCHVVQLVRADGLPRLTELPRSETMGQLLRMSFNHYKQPRQAFDLVGRVARASRAWRLEYGEPRAAAELLMARLGATSSFAGADLDQVSRP